MIPAIASEAAKLAAILAILFLLWIATAGDGHSAALAADDAAERALEWRRTITVVGGAIAFCIVTSILALCTVDKR